MDDRTLLTTGIAGAVVAALCCATPVFVIVLGAVGFSAWVGLVGYVLIPALVVCIGLTIYALKRHRAEIDGSRSVPSNHTSIQKEAGPDR